MRTKVMIFLWLWHSVSALGHEAAIPSKEISFSDLPNLVKERNENVQSAQRLIMAQQERMGRLARSFLPNVSGRVGSEMFQTGSARVQHQGFWRAEANVNLYRGGRDRLENDIRVSNVRAAKSGYSSELAEEIREARQIFWRLIAIEKIITDRKEGLLKNAENLRSAQRRAGAGVTTAADTVQFELHKTLLTQDLKTLQHEQDVLKSHLTVALGIDDHISVEIVGEFPHPEVGELSVEELKPQNQLTLKTLKENHLTEKMKQEQASRWWHPRVDLYGDYGIPALSEEYDRALRKDKEWSAGIRLAIDLGQGYEDRRDSKARALESSALAMRISHKTREVVALDHELRHNLKLLHDLIHDSDKDIEKAERFLKLTDSEYSRGVKNGPDLLEAFQKLYDFRKRRTELYREYHEHHASLLALVAKED